MLNLVTPEELALTLKVPVKWIYTQVQADAIPYYRLGGREAKRGHLRFNPDEIHQWMKERHVQPTAA